MVVWSIYSNSGYVTGGRRSMDAWCFDLFGELSSSAQQAYTRGNHADSTKIKTGKCRARSAVEPGASVRSKTAVALLYKYDATYRSSTVVESSTPTASLHFDGCSLVRIPVEVTLFFFWLLLLHTRGERKKMETPFPRFRFGWPHVPPPSPPFLAPLRSTALHKVVHIYSGVYTQGMLKTWVILLPTHSWRSEYIV